MRPISLPEASGPCQTSQSPVASKDHRPGAAAGGQVEHFVIHSQRGGAPTPCRGEAKRMLEKRHCTALRQPSYPAAHGPGKHGGAKSARGKGTWTSSGHIISQSTSPRSAADNEAAQEQEGTEKERERPFAGETAETSATGDAVAPNISEELRRQNEELRLQVQAMREEQLFTAELHSQVIANIVRERNGLEEKLQGLQAQVGGSSAQSFVDSQGHTAVAGGPTPKGHQLNPATSAEMPAVGAWAAEVQKTGALFYSEAGDSGAAVAPSNVGGQDDASVSPGTPVPPRCAGACATTKQWEPATIVVPCGGNPVPGTSSPPTPQRQVSYSSFSPPVPPPSATATRPGQNQLGKVNATGSPMAARERPGTAVAPESAVGKEVPTRNANDCSCAAPAVGGRPPVVPGLSRAASWQPLPRSPQSLAAGGLPAPAEPTVAAAATHRRQSPLQTHCLPPRPSPICSNGWLQGAPMFAAVLVHPPCRRQGEPLHKKVASGAASPDPGIRAPTFRAMGAPPPPMTPAVIPIVRVPSSRCLTPQVQAAPNAGGPAGHDSVRNPGSLVAPPGGVSATPAAGGEVGEERGEGGGCGGHPLTSCGSRARLVPASPAAGAISPGAPPPTVVRLLSKTPSAPCLASAAVVSTAHHNRQHTYRAQGAPAAVTAAPTVLKMHLASSPGITTSRPPPQREVSCGAVRRGAGGEPCADVLGAGCLDGAD
jgi:hypothetical protein